MRSVTKGLVPVGVVAAGTIAAAETYRRALRAPVLTWGATAEEAELLLPGDELLEEADVVSTRAVTIAAPPSAVWPWLVQMGSGRGGAYSRRPDARSMALGLTLARHKQVPYFCWESIS